MMNKGLLAILLVLYVFGCKEKKKQNAADFFPVTTYLKGQIAQMDSSVASIIMINRRDSVVDTTYINKEEFKRYASEFLQLPDISSDELKDDYEVANLYDDLLNAFVFTYTTKEPDNEIKKQDVIVEPSEAEKSIIKAIAIDKWVTKGDSTVHKNMLWEANRRFLIVTKVEKPNQPEKVSVVEVKWNDFTL
ncbi:MAG TPA: hypothetical protein VM368_07795 [Flavisolibacter sp.]|nr:hypothetical protein [Flavisolibacter sp.]